MYEVTYEWQGRQWQALFRYASHNDAVLARRHIEEHGGSAVTIVKVP
jgi:hypothetical protein